MLIIDGHNLVPKIPGLSLREMDDEERLVAMLQTYARVTRKKIEVFFDDAPLGYAGTRNYGIVRAHFVPIQGTADEAIHQYLVSLGKGARNVTVVSEDGRVRADARALHAQVISSEKFAAELLTVQAQAGPAAVKKGGKPNSTGASAQPAVSAHEVDEMLKAFGIDPALADQPIEIGKRKKEPRPAGKKKKKG